MGLDIIPTQDWWIGANDLWKVKNDFMQKKTVQKNHFRKEHGTGKEIALL